MARRFKPGEMSMKKLLVLIALGTILAAPAFAQDDPNAYRRGRTSAPQRPSTVPPGGIYYYKHNGNPHHQLGGSRSKRTPTKHARRHGSVSQK
jgi:hypothetical protein